MPYSLFNNFDMTHSIAHSVIHDKYGSSHDEQDKI